AARCNHFAYAHCLAALLRSINENDCICLSHLLRQLGYQLRQDAGSNARPAQPANPFDDPRAKTIVSAQGIAVSHYQDLAGTSAYLVKARFVRHLSSNNWPLPSSRCTCTGICPSAWVEQLRHGS